MCKFFHNICSGYLSTMNKIISAKTAAYTITAIMAAWAASWLALPDTNQKSWVRFLPFIPLAFLMGVLVHGMFTTSTLTLTECLKMGRYDCILRIIIYSLLPAGLMFYTIQKAAPVRCCWAGTMAGLSVASFGYIWRLS